MKFFKVLLVAAVASVISLVSAETNTYDQVYFFTNQDYTGERFTYNLNQGYVQLPESFHNHVGSFIAGNDVCFIKWQPRELVQVHAGESNRHFNENNNFGNRIDGVFAGKCRDNIFN